jgi:hypothetical protein
MSTLVPTPTTWQWPADVLTFAAEQQVTAYLEPLRAALERLFPTTRSMKVFKSTDPEIRDDHHIVFDVVVGQTDVPDYLAANKRWHDELFAICPAPLVCVFRLCLIVVEE